MNELPLLGCKLDDAGVRAQRERYRIAGEGASVLERGPRRLRVRVGRRTEPTLVEQLVSVERACCPFFALEWDPAERVLGVGVADPEHEPALAAIEYALGLTSGD